MKLSKVLSVINYFLDFAVSYEMKFVK